MNFCLRIILTLLTLMPALASVAKSVPFCITDGEKDLGRMLNLREKTRLVVGAGYGPLLSGFNIPFCRGIVAGAAGQTNGNPRMGIRPLVLSDGPAGLRLKTTPGSSSPTAFPIGSLLACSWDTAYVRQVGEAMGYEARQHGVDVLLAPGMNLMRNPLCGRNFEYFSEDPLLTGWMATGMVRGIQGQGVGACVKHFVANNQETNRKHNDSRVDANTLRELYLKPFEIVVREAQPWTLMSSYNKVNGELAQQSHALLTEVLRQEWGYEGVVMTDWTGKRNTVAQLQAGNDLIMPGLKRQRWQLKRAVRRGKLCECELDESVQRILELEEKCNAKPAVCFPELQALPGHAALGMVLLENRDETLPLALSGRCVALFGATSYEMIVGGTGSGHVAAQNVVDLPSALLREGALLDESLSALYVKYIRRKGNRYPSTFYLNHFLGKGGLKEMPLSREEVERAMLAADLAILTIGRQAGEGKDRGMEGDFLLTDTERRLMHDVADVSHALGKRLIVVLNVGGVIETASWKDLPDAVLLAWSPGQDGGTAMVDILTGRYNPSACLSMTWPIRYEDLPSAANFPVSGREGKRDDAGLRQDWDYTTYAEGMEVGYRYFHDRDVPVSYPFGYGLSYTRFQKSAPLVRYDAEGNLLADVEVTNVGERAGSTVVQLYGKREGMPTELLTFAKTSILMPGETRRLTLRLPAWLVPRGLSVSGFSCHL